jgi:hypothetical protein
MQTESIGTQQKLLRETIMQLYDLHTHNQHVGREIPIEDLIEVENQQDISSAFPIICFAAASIR